MLIYALLAILALLVLATIGFVIRLHHAGITSRARQEKDAASATTPKKRRDRKELIDRHAVLAKRYYGHPIDTVDEVEKALPAAPTGYMWRLDVEKKPYLDPQYKSMIYDIKEIRVYSGENAVTDWKATEKQQALEEERIRDTYSTSHLIQVLRLVEFPGGTEIARDDRDLTLAACTPLTDPHWERTQTKLSRATIVDAQLKWADEVLLDHLNRTLITDFEPTFRYATGQTAPERNE